MPLTISPPWLRGSVPRTLSSACYEALEWKFLWRLCVGDFLPLFKGDSVLLSCWPHALHSKKGLGFCSWGWFCFCSLLLLVWPFLFVFSCRPDIWKGRRWLKVSCVYIFFGKLLPWMGNGIMDSAGHGGTLTLCPSLRITTCCFSFQICDCTSSFHMKEFSLFK